MKLTDMELPKRSKKEMENTIGSVYEGDKYPYGLRIQLETEALNKLGLKPSNFKIGQTVTITAKANVEMVSEREAKRGNDSMEVSLQITDLAVDTKKSIFKNGQPDEPGMGGMV